MIFEIERKLKDIYEMNKQKIDDYHISIAVLNNFGKDINKRTIKMITPLLQNFEELLNQNKCLKTDMKKESYPVLSSVIPVTTTSIPLKSSKETPTPPSSTDLSGTFLQISPEQKQKGIINRVFGDGDPFGVSYYNRKVLGQFRDKYPGEKYISYIQSNFPPIKSFKIQGKDFRLSKIFTDAEGREFAIIYPRLGDIEETAVMLYRSNSAGVWRFTPIVIGTRSVPQYIKGSLHYTNNKSLTKRSLVNCKR